MNRMKLAAMSEGCPVNRPRLEFYHPNAKGTGCAMAMALRPADSTQNGYIAVSIANQMTVGNPMGANPTFPTFDWENSVDVCLCFDDLTLMLQVLRGETESINCDRGLWHKYGKCCQKIQFCHMLDPVCGYSFEVFGAPADNKEEEHVRMLLSPAEALGLCEAIAGSMYLITFGRPYATV